MLRAYTDQLVLEEDLVQVLHVARYYGCDQLVALIERSLVLMLRKAEERNAPQELVPTPHKLEPAPHELASAPHELAPQLLAIALDEGLARLEQAALDYVSAWSGCMWRMCRRKGCVGKHRLLGQ